MIEKFEKDSEPVFARIKNNQGEALHIINSEGIVYHQHEVLYIIKPQKYTLRVMIYAFCDDIHACA